MQNSEICVPAAAVSEFDDSDDASGAAKGVEPSAGDEIEVTIKGKVTRTEGGNVYFTATEANGQPMGEPKGDDSGRGGGDTEASMDAMMSGADQPGEEY